MDPKVKSLFRIETKDIITFEDFDRVFYVFQQLVLYDIDVPEIEGLSERLPYALNTVATEKLDRNDIITFFPIIWGKFEPYARKLLYVIKPEKYEEICRKRKGTLQNVLEGIGIKVFVKGVNRTDETQAVFETYKMRNVEAHECELWSVRECYDQLAKTIAAFLIITKKVLPEVQIAMEKIPADRRIVVSDINYPTTTVDIFDERYSCDLFYNLNDYCSGYRRIGEREYDRNGWILSWHFLWKDHESVTRYEYETDGKRIIKCKLVETPHRTPVKEGFEDKDVGYYTYGYDYDGKLNKIQRFRWESRLKKYFLRQIIEIEYLTQGGVIVTKRVYRLRDNQESKDEYEVEKRYYDSKGFLIWRNNECGDTQYMYSDNGVLTRIEYPDNSFDEIKYLGDNVFRIHRNRNVEVIKEKRLYLAGRLRTIQWFRNRGGLGKPTDEPQLTNEFVIDYFENN